MPISLPPDLDTSIQQKVTGAGYHTPKEKKQPAVLVWQRFQNAVRSIPEEELASLPPDGASKHDRYLYGI